MLLEVRFKSMADAEERPALLSIGDVAARSGLAASALRFYERLDLITAAGRRSGHRVYDPSVFNRLATIDLLAQAGFTLAEIGAFSRTDASTSVGDIHTRARLQLQVVQRQIDELQLAQRILEHIAHCPIDPFNECPSFQALIAAHAAAIGDPCVDPSVVESARSAGLPH